MKIKFRLDIVLEGEKSDFLSIRFLDEDVNEFEKVLDEYENSEKYGNIIYYLADRIKLMANKFGIRKEFFLKMKVRIMFTDLEIREKISAFMPALR